MEKYTTFDHIKKKDICKFNGLEDEVLTYIYHSPHKVPLSIESFGITFPNSNFHIQRMDATYFILEYIVSGKGYLKIDGKLHELHANDVYLLEPGSSHEYYADKNAPFKKYWINFRSDVFFNIFNELHQNNLALNYEYYIRKCFLDEISATVQENIEQNVKTVGLAYGDGLWYDKK